MSTPSSSEVFLVTKLVVPRPPPGLVVRPRLLDLLDRGALGPLTLVSAPAGWGKTALVSTWLAGGSAPGAPAWLSLGKEDRDRRPFWTGVLRALGLPPAGVPDGVVAQIVASLAKREKPVTLVLDDFHEVADPAAAADVQTLVEHAPPALRLVICSRTDPPLRLQRLRVSGQLTEVRARELAFTVSETGELGRALGLRVAGRDLELLRRRTEGWPAGLRLAALSLVEHPDPHAFVERFAGDDRAVSDYLLSEVLSRQPPETLAFLLRTCVVEQISGGLADALVGTNGGAAMLATLMRRDGLVGALDAQGAWCRYHPLLLEVLRIELRRTLPDEIPELHRRAARWYQRHGRPLEAIDHAVQAEDWDLMADALAEHWLTLVVRGRGASLRALLERVPDRVVRSDPELALATAALRFEAGDCASADELLAIADALAARLPAGRRRRLAVTATATRLHRACLGGDVSGALEAARSVVDEAWDGSLSDDLRALVLANLGVAELWADDAPSARRHLQDAIGVARRCGNDYLLFGAQAWAALVALASERMDEARRRATAALDIAEPAGWGGTPAAGVGYLTLAALRLLEDDLGASEELLERAKRALDRSGERLPAAGLAQIEATLLAAYGQPLTALDVLRGATGAAGVRLPRFLRVSATMLEAELLLALGEPTGAQRLLAETDATESASDAGVGLAHLSLAIGRPDAAIEAVATFVADERAPVRPAARVEAWVLDAIARDEIRDEEGALRALERALDLAEPRGLVRPVVRHGAPVRSLLRRHIRNGTAHRAFAGELLTALEDDTAHDAGQAGPLLEPLSERELAVLRFLPTMMSNTEIAAEMFVSVNTVKTHLKHIYRKLDVTDRRDAVRRGRDLRLLSPGLRSR
jgi:LuxR family maltose regulon positive regulatory protein